MAMEENPSDQILPSNSMLGGPPRRCLARGEPERKRSWLAVFEKALQFQIRRSLAAPWISARSLSRTGL
jgi:hypothetical protein